MDRVSLFGLSIDCFTASSLNQRILDAARGGEHIYVANVNVNALEISSRNAPFRTALEQADHIFCDGGGVILAGRLLGQHLPEKITYAQWLPELAAWCATHGLSIYFLGGRPGIAKTAADTLVRDNPALIVAGVRDGYFDMTSGSEENSEAVAAVSAAKPNILVVCFGMPRQELWLRENWDQLDVNVGLTGGAAFDYVAGAVKRPPQWMNDHCLEWLGRLLYEPRRLWKRYTIGQFRFVRMLVGEWLRQRRAA